MQAAINLPTAPGAYLVELWLDSPQRLRVGRLGELLFPAGAYLYMGSACGPGGLRGRLGRHLQGRGAARPHWHIDALRHITRVRAAAALALAAADPALAGLECRLTRLALSWPAATVAAPGFGASDCGRGCPAHLASFPGDRFDDLPILQRPSIQAILAQFACDLGAQFIT